MIKIDYNFTLREIIGKEGFEYKELKELEKKTIEVHNRIIEQKVDDIGFFNLINQNLEELKLKVDLLKKKYKNMVVFGIGGSALGAKAIYSAIRKSSPRNLYIIDNIDPDFFHNFLKSINLEDTCFTVISKSGSTTETISQFLIILNELGKSFYEKLIIITDPKKGGLREFAIKFNVLNFEIPENVGGRYSVLSPVGLVPLYFVDINIDDLINGAKRSEKICSNPNLFENPAYLAGTLQYLSFLKNKNVSVLFAYSRYLEEFTEWFKQLWAESLGKENKGLTPLKAVGVTDQHSLLQLFMDGPNDKIITFLQVEEFQNRVIIPEIDNFDFYSYLHNKTLNEIFKFECESVKIALAKKGRINYTIILDKLNEFSLGELIFYFMIKTVFTGYLMEINPFDQPGVEEGKNFTYGLMGRKGFENKRKEFSQFNSRRKKEFII